MKMRILAIGLALGLTSLLLNTACSQQDVTAETAETAAQEMSAAVEKPVETAEAEAEQGVQKLVAVVERKPRKQGRETIIEEDAQGDEIRLEYAGQAAQSAYDRARARAAGQFDNARDVFDKD